jgi:hypothetical protein
MAELLHISFDNSGRLTERSYLFQYHGVQFKLVQDNPRERADSLLTIVPKNDANACDYAYSVAAEFLSALAWQHRVSITLRELGRRYPTVPNINDIEPSLSDFPRLPYWIYTTGYELARIPKIENAQKIALGLFREANSSNNDFLSFLFFWQVLETGANADPVGFINKTLIKLRPKLGLTKFELAELPLSDKKLGNYLLDNCRDAVAHIRRTPGEVTLDVDNREDRLRMAVSKQVIKAFAKLYIQEILQLKKTLHLKRFKSEDIPVFVDQLEPTIAI